MRLGELRYTAYRRPVQGIIEDFIVGGGSTNTKPIATLGVTIDTMTMIKLGLTIFFAGGALHLATRSRRKKRSSNGS